MSTKKIYNTIGLSVDVWEAVRKLGAQEQRSKSFIIEECLRKALRLHERETSGDKYANKA